MARDFYPFVEKDPSTSDSSQPQGIAQNGVQNSDENISSPSQTPMEVSTPARIAVYDDAAAAPRVVMVEPKDVRSFLEEITATVNRLSHEQGGTIPFMVIREIVENFIHAYFKAPTITILDGGNTIRFSDQGPGIKQKDLALEYGTSSATEEMKHYIRGVGSGLPYAQQYMVDKGGSLDIEDNLGGGTVVTISTHPREEPPAPQAPMAGAYGQPYQQQWPQQPQPFGQAYGQQWPTQPWQQSYGQQAPAGMPQQQTGWQQPQPYGQPWQQQAPAGMPTQQQPWQQAKDEASAPRLRCVLRHLLECCAQTGYLIGCVLPDASARILGQLNAGDLFRGLTPAALEWGILPAGHRINDPAPVFPRILSEEEKAKLAEKAARAAKKQG